MRKKEVEERIRLLEYENQKLRYELTEIRKKIKVAIPPMPPFCRIEVNKLGCSWSLPTYEELRRKYRESAG
jgi:hypothetical protein